MVRREMGYRKLNTALALVFVTIAVGFVAGVFSLLKGYDAAAQALVAEKEAVVKERSAEMEDEFRKLTKGMGFNVLILPKDQNLADLYADDFASQYMPESYADTLANSNIVTIQHLLPSLHQKTIWPEKKRTIIVSGVKGQVPYAHRNPKNPIMDPVAPQEAVVGYELWHGYNLAVGDTTLFKGQSFVVSKCHEERGNKDDITLWINLGVAQEMFGKKGLINAILALECRCIADGIMANIAKIRADLERILPETQVIEFMSQALTRAEARYKAAMDAKEAAEHEQTQRIAQRREREKVAALLAPLIILGCGAMVGLLFFANARQRKAEIGVLQALGLRSSHIIAAFLEKAAFVGLVGGLAGYLFGTTGGAILSHYFLGLVHYKALINPVIGIGALVLTPIGAMVASWLPSLAASRLDPAEILREE